MIYINLKKKKRKKAKVKVMSQKKTPKKQNNVIFFNNKKPLKLFIACTGYPSASLLQTFHLLNFFLVTLTNLREKKGNKPTICDKILYERIKSLA